MNPTIKEERSKKRQEKDGSKQKINIIQSKSDVSSSERDCPYSTSRISKRHFVHTDARVLGSIYADEDFVNLFPGEGQPVEAPNP